ncbi:MAG: hypothetical protein IJ733_09235 [Lachnospiraceae bacterium]|nr:hypothetical protein [Lachnospiraceae bacterium]
MARFCGHCGRPLAEGEICSCQAKAGQSSFGGQMNGGQSGYSQQQMSGGQSGYGQPQGNQRQPGYGNPQMSGGQSGYGNPQMNGGQPGYGNPQMNGGQSGYGNPQMNQGQPGYGQPQMNGGQYGQPFGGQGAYNPYGQPQFSQQVNQTLGKATNATKNLFAKIGTILKNPVGELKAISESGSSSLGLQMIGFNLVVVMILVLIALLSLRARLGEYARYANIPYFQTIFVCVVTMAIYYFAEAGILFGFTKAFSKGARVTFSMAITPIGGMALYNALILVVGVLLSILNAGLGAFIIVAGYIFTYVLLVVVYCESVPLTGNAKFYVLGITQICLIIAMTIAFYLIVVPAVEQIGSTVSNGLFGNFLGGLGKFY